MTTTSELEKVEILTDQSQLDREMIHAFLRDESYWARGVSRDIVDRSIDHSLNFGAYLDGRQVGYARVITDRATFAHLRDVFVVAEHRGQGIGSRLVQAVLDHPELQGLRRILLVTRDAAAFYTSLGFSPLTRPDRFLAIERSSKELYRP